VRGEGAAIQALIRAESFKAKSFKPKSLQGMDVRGMRGGIATTVSLRAARGTPCVASAWDKFEFVNHNIK
jgi:hypothetical protein